MPSITDLFAKASNGTAPVATTLASQKSNGAGSASISLATGWPTTTPVNGLLYKVDANNNMVANTLLVWKGILSGTTISSFTVKSGTDDVYAAGSVIEMAPTSSWADDLITGILVDHTTLGYHNDLHASNGKLVLGLTDGASTANNLRITSAVAGAGPIISSEGTDTDISPQFNGKGAGRVKIDGAQPQKFFALYDFIESGCTWTADAAGSTLLASMSSGFVWIGGKRLTVAAQPNHAFPASKDNYIDFTDNGDGTALITYVAAVANNAASPALTTSGLRNAIIVTGATNIASAASINQGQEDRVLPIRSSIPMSVEDELGNLICPRDQSRKLLGYRQCLTEDAGITTETTLTAMTVPVIVPTNRKILITINGSHYSSVAGDFYSLTIKEDGVAIDVIQGPMTSTSGQQPMPTRQKLRTATAGLHTYTLTLTRASGTGLLHTFTSSGGSPTSMRIDVE